MQLFYLFTESLAEIRDVVLSKKTTHSDRNQIDFGFDIDRKVGLHDPTWFIDPCMLCNVGTVCIKLFSTS